MMRSYSLGVNAYVVKPVDFHEFVNAVKELGVFWAIINEPPPGSLVDCPWRIRCRKNQDAASITDSLVHGFPACRGASKV